MRVEDRGFLRRISEEGRKGGFDCSLVPRVVLHYTYFDTHNTEGQ